MGKQRFDFSTQYLVARTGLYEEAVRWFTPQRQVEVVNLLPVFRVHKPEVSDE